MPNYDRGDRHHAEAARVLAQPQRRILFPFVLAELEYLVSRLGGQAAETGMLEDITRGAFELAPFGAADVARAMTIIQRYADLALGLADASIVVLAERHNCHDILTLDQRHFRAVTGPGNQPFRLLPLDATDGPSRP